MKDPAFAKAYIAELKLELATAEQEIDMRVAERDRACLQRDEAREERDAHYQNYKAMMQERDTAKQDAAELARLFKIQSIRSFVAGAAWWEFHQTGATMWASDRDEAWAHAKKRFPFAHVDHRENDDVLLRFKERGAKYLPQGDGNEERNTPVSV